MYIYTEKAQRRAEEIGVEPRRAGTVALCGWQAVDGLIAKAWENKGYIYKVEQEDRECIH